MVTRIFRDVTVILPALNEESSIGETIRQVQLALPSSTVLVVDNGSIDRTPNVALANGAKVIFESRKGKGYAVRRAFQTLDPECSVVFLVDADDTYEVTRSSEAVELIKKFGYGMIVGNRKEILDDRESRKPAFRTGHSLGNYVISRLSKALAPTGIEDSLSGWRAMSRGFVDSFNSSATGFEIEAELNSHAYLIDCSILNIDVKYRGRKHNSESKLNTYVDGFKIIKRSFELFRNNRPHLAFNLLALPWIAASLWLILRAITNYLDTGLLAQFPSLIAGVGTFIISGMLWVCGIILERIKLIRAEVAQALFRGN